MDEKVMLALQKTEERYSKILKQLLKCMMETARDSADVKSLLADIDAENLDLIKRVTELEEDNKEYGLITFDTAKEVERLRNERHELKQSTIIANSQNEKLGRENLNIIKKLETLEKENKDLKLSISNANLQYEELEKNIILKRDQIYKDGRTPVLTAEEVEFVRDLRKQGLSYRKIEAEMNHSASHETIRQVVINDDYKPKVKNETNTDKSNALNKTSNDSDKNKTNAFGGSF